MNKSLQYVCATCGLIFLAMFTIGLWTLAGLVPPTAPAMEVSQVADFYRQNTGVLRAGLMLVVLAGPFTAPWIALISLHVRRTEGSFPLLATTQLAAGVSTIPILIFPFVALTAVAYRPERMPELTQLMSDFSWLLFLMTVTPFLIQLCSIGLAALLDGQKNRVFPRWVGYFNIWVAILLLPGALITFFKTGPFAWDGLIAFWIPLVAFFAWYLVMYLVLLKVIREHSESD